MKPEETIYFVVAMRPIGNNEDEADFIINDETLVIDAVERCSMLEFDSAAEKLKKAFPLHTIMITYLPLLEAFGMLTHIQDLEKELVKSGEIAHVDNDQSRLRKAFDWECKHNTAIHGGSC